MATKSMKLLAALGLGILGVGVSAVASCIIPDKGIHLENQDCGFRWCGKASGAKGFNAFDDWTHILLGGDPVEGCVCFSAGSHDILTSGIEQDCHTHTDETSCELGSCEWKEDVESSGVDLCLPSSICFQSRWLEIVRATEQACEDEAANQVMDPEPADCASESGQTECNAVDGCQWSGGLCIVEGKTCTTAAFSNAVFDKEESCPRLWDECNGATGGGADDGACYGADETGAPSYGGGGWGELSELISCSSRTKCTIDQELIDDIAADPSQMLYDDTRLAFESIGGFDGMQITGIDEEQLTGELAMELKLEEDDLIFDIDGLPLTNEQELYAVVEHLTSVSTTIVRLRRDGSTVAITYSRSSH